MISQLKRMISGKRLNAGDIFCMEMESDYKLYFQYIGDDGVCDSGALIRVFRTRYKPEEKPDADVVVADDVMFYAHTPVTDGMEAGVWRKTGNSPNLGLEKLSGIWFGKTLEYLKIPANPPFECHHIDRIKYWRLWQFNGKLIETNGIFVKAEEVIDPAVTYPGAIQSWRCIIEYARSGYYRDTAPDYEILKRIPHEYADSFVRIGDHGIDYLFHFKGSEVEREIVLGNGTAVGLSKDHPESGVLRLNGMKFGDINWDEDDFITQDEFEAVWQHHQYNN